MPALSGRPNKVVASLLVSFPPSPSVDSSVSSSSLLAKHLFGLEGAPESLLIETVLSGDGGGNLMLGTYSVPLPTSTSTYSNMYYVLMGLIHL